MAETSQGPPWKVKALDHLLMVQEAGFNYSKQKSEMAALKAARAEKIERRKQAETGAANVPSVLKHLKREEHTADHAYKKAVDQTTSLVPAVRFQAEAMIEQLLAGVNDAIANGSTASSSDKTSREDFAAQLETFKSGIQDQSKGLPEKMQAIQDDNTRLRSEIDALKANVAKASGSSLATRQLCTSQASEIESLKKSLSSQSDLTTDLRKQLDKIQTSTEAASNLRVEMDALKKELREARPTSAPVDQSGSLPSSYIETYNNDQDALQKDMRSLRSTIQSLEAQIKTLDGRNEKTSAMAYETNGTVKSMDTRVNDIMKQVSRLDAKATPTTPQQFPSPPERPLSLVATQAGPELRAEFQKFVIATNNRAMATDNHLQNLTNESKANAHGIRSLTARYNNITTEGLYQQIMNVLAPKLSKMDKDHAEIKAQLSQLSQLARDIPALEEWKREHTGRVDHLTTRVNAFEQRYDTKVISDRIRGGLQVEISQIKADLQTETLQHQALSTKVNAIVENSLPPVMQQLSDLESDVQKLHNEVEEPLDTIDKLTTTHDEQLEAIEKSLQEAVATTKELGEAQRNLKDSVLEQIKQDCIKVVEDLKASSSEDQPPSPTTEEHDGLRKSVKDLTAAVIKERTDLRERITELEGRLKDAQVKPEPTDLGDILKTIEKMNAILKAHSDHFEAMDDGLIKHFQIGQGEPSKAPKASPDPLNEAPNATNPFKFKNVPTGPRGSIASRISSGTSTPVPAPAKSVKGSGSKTSSTKARPSPNSSSPVASAGFKRRAVSPADKRSASQKRSRATPRKPAASSTIWSQAIPLSSDEEEASTTEDPRGMSIRGAASDQKGRRQPTLKDRSPEI
jgi:chromosome segregation ATPase